MMEFSNIRNINISSTIEPHELEKFKEFSSRVRCYYDENDERILAWLRARDFNLEKSEQMLRRHLIWRHENEICDMLHWKSPCNFFPFLHSGYCKTGGPVFIFPVGFWDPRGLIERGSMGPIIKYFIHALEKFVYLGRAKNTFLQGILICDLQNFSYSQIAHRTVIQGLSEIVKIFEANYPEIVRAVFMINVPLVFNIAFQIVKPLLHSRTLSKIQIFRSDGPKWKNALLEEIEENELPPHWGGSKNGVDEFCSESWSSSPLPPYYFRKITPNFYDEYGNEWSELVVKSGEILEFPINVKINKSQISEKVILKNALSNVSPNSMINWAFYAEDKSEIDIVLYDNGDKKILYEKQGAVGSEKNKEFGQHRLPKEGEYILSLSNIVVNKDIKLHYSIYFTQFRNIAFAN